MTSDDKRVYLYDLESGNPDPVTVISADSPVTQAAFDDDGEVLVVAARDLSTWRLPATETDGEPELIDRHEDMFANTLSMSPNRIAVGTSTHELISFALADDGTLGDRQSVGTLLDSTDTTTTWQVPVRLPADDEIIAGGDTTGNVYVHTLDVPDAREWICGTSTPMTEEQRSTYLPHAYLKGDCDRTVSGS